MLRGVFLGLWLAFAIIIPTTAAERPNFVIMMTDDQRWDAMSCAGNSVLKTPHIDRLAREGMRFTNAFVTNALCGPSRATLLTGLYSHSHGMIDNNDGRRAREPVRRMKPDQTLVSDLLRQAGYEVAFCGKSHQPGALREHKWDYYFGYLGQGNYLKPVIAEGTDGKDQPYEGYMDDVVTERAVRWLSAERSKPFCLFLFFKAPHRPWTRAPRHKDLFAGVTIPKPDTWDLRGQGSPGKPRAFHDAENRVGAFADVPSLDKFVLDYDATIVAVDENVGRVLDTLEKTKRLDSTCVMYTSDNGFFQGEWQAFDKRFMHEPSIRVPLLVRYPPALQAAATNDKMVLNVDLAPTMLDLAGVEIPAWMQGRSFVPLLKGQPTEWRKDWLYEYYEFPGPHSVRKNRGVRTERYKYIHYFEQPEEFELYDLVADPGEKTNLYGRPEHAELTRQLQQRLIELRRATKDPDLR